jgi:hypothetical protein
MIRTIGTCEKNITPQSANVITVGAASIEVVPDQSAKADEVAYITIQNTGANTCYYAFGQTCDATANYHGMLTSGMALPVPSTDQVNCFSPSGTTIAVTIFKRDQGL